MAAFSSFAYLRRASGQCMADPAERPESVEAREHLIVV